MGTTLLTTGSAISFACLSFQEGWHCL